MQRKAGVVEDYMVHYDCSLKSMLLAYRCYLSARIVLILHVPNHTADVAAVKPKFQENPFLLATHILLV